MTSLLPQHNTLPRGMLTVLITIVAALEKMCQAEFQILSLQRLTPACLTHS